MDLSKQLGAEDREHPLWEYVAVLTEAVELLLRQTERHLDVEVEAAFSAGQAGTVRLRQIERDQARNFREQLRMLRRTHAAEEGC